MFAVVESGSITSMPRGNKGVQIGDIKHSADIFTSKWAYSLYCPCAIGGYERPV